MPEVCEVCLTSQYLKQIIGGTITNIEVESGRYLKKPIDGFNLLKFPLKIIDIDTKGKFMWMTLSNKNKIFYLMITFGLEGKWSLNELKYTNIIFELEHQKYSYLYFGDTRNFGSLKFTDDVSVLNKKLNKLAPDLLKENASVNEISERFELIKNKNKRIVDILMTQELPNSIGSGLGNYLVPEILYNAKISPHRTITSLSSNDIKKIIRSIQYVLKLCYTTNSTRYISHLSKFLDKHQTGIDEGKYPDFLPNVNTHGEKFEFKVYRRTDDDFGNEIIGEEIIKGRTTYWCPSIQK